MCPIVLVTSGIIMSAGQTTEPYELIHTLRSLHIHYNIVWLCLQHEHPEKGHPNLKVSDQFVDVAVPLCKARGFYGLTTDARQSFGNSFARQHSMPHRVLL